MTTAPPDPREIIANALGISAAHKYADLWADAILARLGAVGLVVGPAADGHADDELLAAAKALPRPPFGAYARWVKKGAAKDAGFLDDYDEAWRRLRRAIEAAESAGAVVVPEDTSTDERVEKLVGLVRQFLPDRLPSVHHLTVRLDVLQTLLAEQERVGSIYGEDEWDAELRGSTARGIAKVETHLLARSIIELLNQIDTPSGDGPVPDSTPDQ